MQKQPDLAKNLLEIFNENAYKAFGKGEFLNHPYMTGYYMIFKDIKDPKFCIILNTSEQAYPTNMTTVGDFVFIVFNVKDLQQFITDLGVGYFPLLLDIIDRTIQKKNERNLPYGYYTDLDGNIKIDVTKAGEVKKIYNMYIEGMGVRQIAKDLRTNFSHVRDVLADNQAYMDMQEKIMPPTKLKKVAELMSQNVKSTKRRKVTTMDKIKELRKKRKQTNAQREAMQNR